MYKFQRNIWVSYASAQQNCIDDLAEFFKSKPNKTDNGQQAWQISAYIRRENESDSSYPVRIADAVSLDNSPLSYQRYLSSGDKIQSVVEAIAKSLRVIIVISPDYIKSKYCLWEFYCILTFNNSKPIIVFDGDINFNKLLTNGAMPYANEQASTIIEALATSYEEHRHEMPDEFTIKDTPVPNYFEQQVEHIKPCVYERTSDNSCQENIYQAFNNIDNSTALERFWGNYETDYLTWSKHRSTAVLLREIQESEGEAFELLDVTALKHFDIDKVEAFIRAIESIVNDSDRKDTLLESIYMLAGLLAVLRIDAEWLVEMQDANPTKTFLSISVPTTVEHPQNKLDFMFAGFAIRQTPIELKPSKEDQMSVSGISPIDPPSVPMTGLSVDTKKSILRDIVGAVMDKYDDELTGFMAQTPSVWKKKFRARAYTRGGMRTDGFIRDICFLVEQHRFTKSQNIGWVKLVRDIIGELNEGADASRLISIGVLELLNKSDNDIVYREDSDLLQDFIDQLIGCNI